jgi:hypothetical protein
MENSFRKTTTSEAEMQTSQASGQSAVSSSPVPGKSVMRKILLIIGILLGFVLFGFLGYYIGVNKQGLEMVSDFPIPTTSSLSPTTTSLPTVAELADGWNKFTHPTVGYTFEYPPGWSGGLVEIENPPEKVYEYFNVKSPDYKLHREYPSLKEGAEFSVTVKTTNEQTVDEIFDSDTLISHIAFNKSYVTVDSQQAIQYDFSYETDNATKTIFIKDDLHYSIGFRYVDKQGKQAGWDDYQRLLLSFKMEQ